MMLAPLRREVLATAQCLSRYGLVWMAGGTVCARDVETGLIVVTPSGLDYADLTPADMVVTDLQLRVVEGQSRPSVALNLWTEFFRTRPDVNGLVHTHSPHATAFSVIDEPIPACTETMADWFGGPVPVAPYRHVEDEDFSTLPVRVMQQGFAVLLGQHGPITVGHNLKHALERAVTLEEAARTWTIAKTIGSPLILTDAQARRSFEYYHQRYGQRASNEARHA
jgi:L-ribulose-5-phosphate 4-epimerase